MNLTSETETEIDLREVCAKYRTRFNIRTPWVFGGREYYTDGMRLVWRDTEKPDNADIGFRPPVSEDIAEAFGNAGEFVPLPTIDIEPRMIPCDVCAGKGKCVECNGSGLAIDIDDFVEVCSLKFNRTLFRTIVDLPDATCAATTIRGDAALVVKWRAGGAIVMPLISDVN